MQQARAKTGAAGRLLLTAPFAGRVRDVAEGLHRGTWVNSQVALGRVVDDRAWRAELRVEEQALARIALGQSAQLYQTGLASAPLRGTVAAIDPGSESAASAGAIRCGRIEAETQSLWQQWLRPSLAALVRECGF